MKKIKTALVTLTSASFIVLSMLHASAADMTKISDIEAKQITSAAKADQFTAMTVKKFNADDAYKIYWLDYFIIENYKKSHDFKSLITDDERIMLPAVNNRESLFKDCDGALIQFKKVNGAYKWNEQRNGDNIINFNAVTEELVNSIDEEIVNIIHTYSDRYYVDIIYIETAENEYAVPYFAQLFPNISKWLSNGQIYTVSDFMDRFDHAYNDYYECMPPDAETDTSLNDGLSTVRTYNTEQTAGDINGNGITDIYDAIEIAESLIGKIKFTEEEKITADFNKDGKINLYDVIDIAKYLLKE